MKIRFQIDTENKILTLYFKNGELINYANKLKEMFPELNSDDRIEKGSRCITDNVAMLLQNVGKKLDLDILTFTPKFVCYKKNYELPSELRITNI